MSTSVTMSEARASLPEIVERVLAGDEVTLTRRGQPVAVIVRPDTLRVRRAGAALDAAAAIRQAIEDARRVPLSATPTAALSRKRADAMIADLRVTRADR